MNELNRTEGIRGQVTGQANMAAAVKESMTGATAVRRQRPLTIDEKLAKLNDIIVAIKRDRDRGGKLYFSGCDGIGIHGYSKSKRMARRVRNIMEAEVAKEYDEGRNGHWLAIEEISLDDILLSLEDQRNPFGDIYNSFSKFPYEWLQELSDLFNSDDDSHWNSYLFEDEEREAERVRRAPTDAVDKTEEAVDDDLFAADPPPQ